MVRATLVMVWIAAVFFYFALACNTAHGADESTWEAEMAAHVNMVCGEDGIFITYKDVEYVGMGHTPDEGHGMNAYFKVPVGPNCEDYTHITRGIDKTEDDYRQLWRRDIELFRGD